MQKILSSFEDLRQVELATVTGTSTILGYLFDDKGRSEDVTLTITDTKDTVLGLYRTFRGDTTVSLPYPAMVIKTPADLYFSTTEGAATLQETLEVGIYKLGSDNTGIRAEFKRREISGNTIGPTPSIQLYYFTGDATGGTINGFLVDSFGVRTGSAFTFTVDTASGRNFEDLYGDVLPADAVGAVIDTDVALVFDVTRDAPATAKGALVTNKASHPTIDVGNGLGYGKVL